MSEQNPEEPLENKPNDSFASYGEMFPKEDFIALGKQVVFEIMTAFEEIKASHHNAPIGRIEPFYIRNRSENRPKTMIESADGSKIESPLSMESLAVLWEILSSGEIDPNQSPETFENLVNDLKHSENLEMAEIDSVTTNGFQIAIEGMYVNVSTDIPGRIGLINKEIEIVYGTIEQEIKRICETLHMTCQLEDQGQLDDEDNYILAAWLLTFRKISEEEL